MFYHVGIDFTEFQPGSYKAVTVGDENRELARFGTGDPQADWAACRAWLDGKGAGSTVIISSSVDHFVQDNPAWGFGPDEQGRLMLRALFN